MTFIEAFRQAAKELGWTPEYLDAMIAKVKADDLIISTMGSLAVPSGEERDYIERAKAVGIHLGYVGRGPRPDLN